MRALINKSSIYLISIILLLQFAQAQKPELVIQKGHMGYITSISFSPDGKLLASGSEDNTIKLFDVVSRKELRTFIGHTSGINSISFAPNGKILASGSSDKTIKLWDIVSGRELSI